MPTVIASDGQRFSFPEGTSRDEIQRRLQSHFGIGSPQAGISRGAQIAGRETLSNANPYTAQVASNTVQQTSMPQPTQRRQSRPEAFARSLIDSMSLGAADELTGGAAQTLYDPAGGAASIGTALQQAVGGFSPVGTVLRAGGGLASALMPASEGARAQGAAAQRAMTGAMRTGLQQAYEQRPATSVVGGIAGALPFGVAGSGAGAMRLGQRVLAGAGTGAATGGVYGYNTGEDPQGRLQNALGSGGAGAAFGAAFAPVASGLARIGRIQNTGQRAAVGAGLAGAVGAGGLAGYDVASGMAQARDDARVERVLAQDYLTQLREQGGDAQEIQSVEGYIRQLDQQIEGQERRYAAITGMGALGGGLLAGAVGLRARPNAVGMFGGNLTFGDDAARGVPPPSDRERQQVAATLARLAANSRRTENELMQAFDEAATQRRGAVAANVLGEEAQMRAARIGRMPGETRSLATQLLSARSRENLERIGQRITGQRDADPMQVLNERVRLTSQRVLDPLFAEADDAARIRAQRALDRLKDNPEFADALPIAERQIRGLMTLSDRPLPAGASNDPLRLLHYTRIVLQELIKDPTLLRGSTARIDNSIAQSAVSQIRQALDDAIPGYQAALDEIAPEMLPQAVMQSMYALRRPDRGNVAGAGLAAPGMQRAMREGRAPELARILREEDELFQSLQRMDPRTGSQTMPLAADAMDDFATQPPRFTLNPNAILEALYNRASNPLFERQRNLLGRALYTPVDEGLPGYDAQTLSEMRRLLAEAFARRRSASAAATGAGASGYGFVPEAE